MFLSIIGLIIAWFVIRGIINYLFYHDVPTELHGKNDEAKGIHIILNAIFIIVFLSMIFS